MAKYLILAIIITSLLIICVCQQPKKFNTIYKFLITNYVVTHEEYLDIKKYSQTFPVFNAENLNRIETYILLHIKASYSVNKFKDENTVVNSFLTNTDLSSAQIDVIFENVYSIGKYIVPLPLSDTRVNIVFIEKL